MISAWRDDWLYLVNTEDGSAALYNLRDDPYRQNDVADRYPSERKALEAAIEAESQPREPARLSLA